MCQADYIPHTVIIDCTASAEVARHYRDWLARGIHIVTPNKKANSGALPEYRALKEAARAAGTHYLYEATVGAGLPVIQTLRDLRETGDDITRIEGIFSGTLAYLFNVFDGTESFSSIVRAAKRKGYTEPDPRDDLSGMDVARKLIILGREMGLTLEMSDVEVAGLVPPALDGCSVEEFMRRLPEFDASDGDACSQEAQRGRGRCCATSAGSTPDGKATVGLTRLDAKHAFANIALTDNVVRFATRRYCDNPLIVQGPGQVPRSPPAACSPTCCACPPISARICRAMPQGLPVLTDVTAFAPATVANVGIGFDILGHTVEAVGDRVRLRRIDEPLVRDPERSAASPAICRSSPGATPPGARCRRCSERSALEFGFEMEIEKGIPLASGMGGSAASAVAAVVAANALLEAPVPRLQLLKFAMEGEIVASGSAHVDNIAPCLFGGLVLTVGIDHPRVKQIPVPAAMRCVLVHPHMLLGTREARAILKSDVTRSDFVWQTANLAGLHQRLLLERPRHDPRLLQRRHHRAAASGADSGLQGRAARRHVGRRARLLDLRRRPHHLRLGEVQHAEAVRGAMVAAFARHGLESDSWISSLDNSGARVVTADVGIAIRELAQRRARTSALSEAIRQGLAPDGGLYVPTRAAAASIRRHSRPDPVARDRTRRARRLLRGRSRCSPCSARSPGGARFSGADDRRARVPRPAVRARAVSWPDRRFQGFRCALSGRDPRAPADGGGAAHDHIGGDLRRYRRRGGGRLPPPALGANRHALPQGPGERTPGAPAHLLGRQRARAAHRRDLRRLPAPGEGGLHGFDAAAASIASVPPTASTSAACCRRWSTTSPRASRSSGARARRPPTSFPAAISATPSPPCGPVRSGCPSSASILRTTPTAPSRISSRRRVAAAAERRDARLGNGCRQSQQHGAPARPVSDLRGGQPNS